jgi:hypothetical protein
MAGQPGLAYGRPPSSSGSLPSQLVAGFAMLTYLPLTTYRIALEPAPSRTSFMVISPATPGKPLSVLRHSRISSPQGDDYQGPLVLLRA